MAKNPFTVLRLSPTVDAATFKARYRELARKHHPDAAPAADRKAATRVMAELNWAMEELERDPDYWREQAGFGLRSQETLAEPELRDVMVDEALIVLHPGNGLVAEFRAAGFAGNADDVRVEHASPLFRVERVADRDAEIARFRVSMSPGITYLNHPLNDRLYVHALGSNRREVTVAIEPFTQEDLERRFEDREPQTCDRPQHTLEVLGWTVAVALGALTLVLILT